jgi:hypothetical protein
MISKETFLKGIRTYKEGLDFLKRTSDIGLDLYDSPLCSTSDILFDMWLNDITGESGVDLVYWWIFEDVEKKIYEDDKVVADLVDEDSLYNYMKENGYF